MTEYHQETRTQVADFFHPLIPPIGVVRDRKEFVVRSCKDRNVLHIGCVGSGSVRERLHDRSHLHHRLSRTVRSLVGIDINAEGLDLLREAGFERCYRLDVENERIDDSIISGIDIIVIPEVIEHLSNPGGFLDHLKALNFTGDILISAPNAFSHRGTELVKNNHVELVHPDHKYYFSPTTLKTLLSSHGFTVLKHWLYYWPSDDAFGRDFENVLQACPYLAEGIIVLARDARQIADRGSGKRKSTSDGEREFLQGDCGSAEKTFLEILGSDPMNVEVCNNLGVLEFARNHPGTAIHYFARALRIDPFNRDAVFNLADILRSMRVLSQALPYLEKVRDRYPDDPELAALIEEAGTVLSSSPDRGKKTSFPWKLCYSPGVAHHGERYRHMLGLDHYIPSLHYRDLVWFFGMYFDGDYLQVLAHQGKKVINWRGSDALQLRNNAERIRMIRTVNALHVCQSSRQQAVLQDLGIPSLVRPMLNRRVHEISLSMFSEKETEILVFWRSGIDHFIQADMFFEIASLCPEARFHIVGQEDPSRFNKPGMENLVFHGFVDEERLDRIMDQCKGTIRPWVSDGTPNIQSIMLLKGRYAAHSCRFEKVAQCSTADDYVRWIKDLKEIKEPNMEAREWWMKNLNNFDFLEMDFEPNPSLMKG